MAARLFWTRFVHEVQALSRAVFFRVLPLKAARDHGRHDEAQLADGWVQVVGVDEIADATGSCRALVPEEPLQQEPRHTTGLFRARLADLCCAMNRTKES